MKLTKQTTTTTTMKLSMTEAENILLAYFIDKTGNELYDSVNIAIYTHGVTITGDKNSKLQTKKS